MTRPLFYTLTGPDTSRLIQQAREDGRREGNTILCQIRAAVAAHSQLHATQPAPVQPTSVLSGSEVTGPKIS